jgi:NAD+ diphosphatase
MSFDLFQTQEGSGEQHYPDNAFSGMGFVGTFLDRADAVRQNAEQLAALWADPQSRVLVFQDLKPLMHTQQPLDFFWLSSKNVPANAQPIFLGLRAGIAHFALALPTQGRLEGLNAEERMHAKYIDTRSVAAQLGDARTALLAQARALLAWHEKHLHCAVCGALTQQHKGGYARLCSNNACKAEHYPRTDPVVIMLVVAGDKCLLGRQAQFPLGVYSALAGFVEPGETLEAAVRREVLEEAGVQVGAVRYVASQPWPFPSSLMIGLYAQALSTAITIDKAELEDARWFDWRAAQAALAGHGPFVAPPPLAIAHHLLKSWVAQMSKGAGV